MTLCERNIEKINNAFNVVSDALFQEKREHLSKQQVIDSILDRILDLKEKLTTKSKKIDIEQLIKEHSKLNGIIKLKDINYLKSAKIGNFGEIYWSDTIKIKNTLWNYDISPEFIYHHGLDF